MLFRSPYLGHMTATEFYEADPAANAVTATTIEEVEALTGAKRSPYDA